MAEGINKLKADSVKGVTIEKNIPDSAEKKAASPSRKKREAKKSSYNELKILLQDERTPKMFGLILILASLYLFTAFISYLFSWQNDQDYVFHFTWGNLINGSFKAENYLGRLGAYVSHLFIYSGFGLTAFVFPLLLSAGGTNLLLQKKIFRVAKLLRLSLLVLVLIPAAFSFCFQSFAFPFGGAVGSNINSWLIGFIGILGTGALLAFCVLATGIIFFNMSFNLFAPGKKIQQDQKDTHAEHVDQNFPPVVMHSEAVMVNEFLDNMELIEKPIEDTVAVVQPEVHEDISELMENMSSDNNEIQHDEIKSDIELDIVETPEEQIVEEEVVVRENYDPTIDLPKYQYPGLDLWY